MKRYLITLAIAVFVIEIAATSATSTESPEIHESTANVSADTSAIEPLQTTHSQPSFMNTSSAPFDDSPAEISATTSAVDPLPTTSSEEDSTLQATTAQALNTTAAKSQKSTSTSKAIEVPVVAVYASERSSSTAKPSVSSSASQPASSTEAATPSHPGTTPPSVVVEDSMKTTSAIPESGSNGKPINALMSCLIPTFVLLVRKI